METLAEFLNNEKNQQVILEKIITGLRQRGEWGKHGLYARIGKRTGISAAYVGRVLTGKNPVRENFVEKMAEYLGVRVDWLRGDYKWTYDMERELFDFNLLSDEEKERRKASSSSGRSIATIAEMTNVLAENTRRRSKLDAAIAKVDVDFSKFDYNFLKYIELATAFMGVPVEEMDDALGMLRILRDVSVANPGLFTEPEEQE